MQHEGFDVNPAQLKLDQIVQSGGVGIINHADISGKIYIEWSY